MATNAPTVRIDKEALTEEQLRTLEIVLYQYADIRDRILRSGVPYTKIEVPQGGSDAARKL